jgi:hypothetical protein
VQQLWTSRQSSIAPTEFVHHVRTSSHLFSNYGQQVVLWSLTRPSLCPHHAMGCSSDAQDSEEFIRFLVDALHEELKGNSSIPLALSSCRCTLTPASRGLPPLPMPPPIRPDPSASTPGGASPAPGVPGDGHVSEGATGPTEVTRSGAASPAEESSKKDEKKKEEKKDASAAGAEETEGAARAEGAAGPAGDPDDTAMRRIFGGTLVTCVTCEDCGHVRIFSLLRHLLLITCPVQPQLSLTSSPPLTDSNHSPRKSSSASASTSLMSLPVRQFVYPPPPPSPPSPPHLHLGLHTESWLSWIWSSVVGAHSLSHADTRALLVARASDHAGGVPRAVLPHGAADGQQPVCLHPLRWPPRCRVSLVCVRACTRELGVYKGAGCVQGSWVWTRRPISSYFAGAQQEYFNFLKYCAFR